MNLNVCVLCSRCGWPSISCTHQLFPPKITMGPTSGGPLVGHQQLYPWGWTNSHFSRGRGNNTHVHNTHQLPMVTQKSVTPADTVQMRKKMCLCVCVSFSANVLDPKPCQQLPVQPQHAEPCRYRHRLIPTHTHKSSKIKNKFKTCNEH